LLACGFFIQATSLYAKTVFQPVVQLVKDAADGSKTRIAFAARVGDKVACNKARSPANVLESK
jgi:hypothetical protein